jgi:hypothetical protein
LLQVLQGEGSMTAERLASTRWRRLGYAIVVAGALFVILLIPAHEPAPPLPASGKPFVWHQDERWEALEASFQRARAEGCAALTGPTDEMLRGGRRLLARIASSTVQPASPLLDEIERLTFGLGPMVAACPGKLPKYIELVTRMRSVVKGQSRRWDMGSRATRDALYRLLYGGRGALEEAMLQAPASGVLALVPGDDEPSATPSAEVLGVKIHSGDLLVSRGGAPTSALIARGNDYPGNFSHVALVFVDESSGVASVVESHIERGVAIAALPDYLRDVKLRVMVLRPRADLPRLVADPLLPHRAAAAMIAEARGRHIPYDFEMDFRDHGKLFCSEVASAAYGRLGITLWMELSRISSPGLASWLSQFGVTHFETQEPSDLEYDPQLAVVAEWRNPETLFSDHLDNAVVDAMLEGAERSETLTYNRALLPVARIAKATSSCLNVFGLVGPVPEGLSATAALRTRRFIQTHTRIKERVLALAEEFRRQHGYVPPYWELVKLARRAHAEITGGGNG